MTFQNSVPFQTTDPTGGGRRVYDVGSPIDTTTGVGLAGSQWVAELYAGSDAASLTPFPGSISRFRNTTTASKGRWGTTTLAGTPNDPILLPYPIGSTVTMQVKVWDYSQFQTYEDAAAGQGVTGASPPFQFVVPSASAAVSAHYMEGLRAFALGLPPGCTRHKAQATAQLTGDTVTGITLTDPGCGYTNPPAVFIQGGGGTGATATAVIANSQIIAINITNPGCCYTNVPTVLIASPWFAPSASIATSRVRVTEHVVLGRQYALQASFDMVNWIDTGPPFIATSETVQSGEFDVSATGGFFRVREVP